MLNEFSNMNNCYYGLPTPQRFAPFTFFFSVPKSKNFTIIEMPNQVIGLHQLTCQSRLSNNSNNNDASLMEE